MSVQTIDSPKVKVTMDLNDDFARRHIGPDKADVKAMLSVVGAKSLEDLIATTVPESILLGRNLNLPAAVSENQAIDKLRELAGANQVKRSMVGMGYYGTHVPNVILRNVLENPGWYTAYTPYQAEIAQGRLESLLTFQQMVMDLTGMEIANASLLDEATAAAEAMALCKRASRRKSNLFFIADDVHPHTLDVVRTRANYFGYELLVAPAETVGDHDVFGALLQYPGTTGQVRDLSECIQQVHANKGLVAVASDLLALTVLKTPGEMGADIVLGSAQRFGVPMGFGGPHAAFFATRDAFKRSMPGRVIGVSKDRHGKTALRMAMQTREQHIRRDKATSNICTAQALLANMAVFYAVYHGPEGIKAIAQRTHGLASWAAEQLVKTGFKLVHDDFFDTAVIETEEAQAIVDRAAAEFNLNLRLVSPSQVGFSFDETTTVDDVRALLNAFGVADAEKLEPEVAGFDSVGLKELQR